MNFIAEHADTLIGFGVGVVITLVVAFAGLCYLFKDFRIR